MTAVRFYHLQRSTLETALPALLEKALGQGKRAVVKMRDREAAARLNDHLWTYRADSFLPHGCAADKAPFAADQPVWLTDGDDNPNGADVLILAGGAQTPDPAAFSLCCEMLDGRDEAQVQAARARWKQYKDAGLTVEYWQQDEDGKWRQSA